MQKESLVNKEVQKDKIENDLQTATIESIVENETTAELNDNKGIIEEIADNSEIITNGNIEVQDKNERFDAFKKVKKPNLWKRFVKRTFDIFSSFVAILLLSPFFLIFTPIVAIAMKGNPFFVQARPGKNEKIFKMIKYRTMTNAKDKDGKLLADSERLTKFGKIMRSLSIDELPELFNILVGNMSVVGPRPLLVKYLTRYNEFQKQRHLVRPGLTGLAQVSGRNAISWEQKFEKDIEYIEKLSFWYDLKIIFLTIKKVLVRDGISQEGEATMEEFFNTDN